jgi:ribosomal protein S18 acetylase RimI-like enzyme
LDETIMEIRDVTQDDAAGMAALVDAVARERRFLAGTVGFPVESTRAFIASVKAVGGVQVVAVESGEIIGWCDIVPHAFEGMKHSGRLGMGVRKEYRFKGVGRMLLEVAIPRAFAAGMDRVELEVFESNGPAIRLYESFGFQPEGRKVGGRKLEGVCEDILLFAKRPPASGG